MTDFADRPGAALVTGGYRRDRRGHRPDARRARQQGCGLVQRALPLLRASHGSLVAVTTAANRRFPVRDGLSTAPKAAIEAVVRGIASRRLDQVS